MEYSQEVISKVGRLLARKKEFALAPFCTGIGSVEEAWPQLSETLGIGRGGITGAHHVLSLEDYPFCPVPIPISLVDNVRQFGRRTRDIVDTFFKPQVVHPREGLRH